MCENNKSDIGAACCGGTSSTMSTEELMSRLGAKKVEPKCGNANPRGFGFDAAIKWLKDGFRLRRKGWNGKGQFIELAKEISYTNHDGIRVNPYHDAIGNNAVAFVGTSGTQLGWLASQADMLAEDWEIVK